MFNQQILEVLKRNDRENRFDTHGSPTFLRGGIRYGLHPTPEMDFQPDNLYTGRERYEDIKPHMVGGRMIGGVGQRVHHGAYGKYSGGSLKSFGRSVLKGLKKVGHVLEPVVKTVGKDIVLPVVKDFATKQGRKMLEQGLEKYGPMVAEGAMMAAGRSRKMRGCGMVGGRMVGGGRREARAALVKKIMREHGCSLPEASKYIKEHGIEY